MELQIKDHVASCPLVSAVCERGGASAGGRVRLPAARRRRRLPLQRQDRGARDRGRGSRPTERESSSSVAPSFSYG